MPIGFHATKLVVGDLGAAERFYRAIGLEVVSRNTGGEAEVNQEQTWLAASGDGDGDGHVLILSQFLELPTPAAVHYPGEVWLAFRVDDVDQMLRTIEQAGGAIVRPAEDRPEHAVRAAVAADCEGHFLEIVGPMAATG